MTVKHAGSWHIISQTKRPDDQSVHTHTHLQHTVEHATHTHTDPAVSVSAGCSVVTWAGASPVCGFPALAMAGPQRLPFSERKPFRRGEIPDYIWTITYITL